MDVNMQMEQFSRAYVQAVAACAGFSWSVPSVDDDSVDMVLHQRGGTGNVCSPKIDIQLKCKSSPLPTDDSFSLSIKMKNYDDLRVSNLLVPRILVVVLVPKSEAKQWLRHSEEELALRHCGYWMSLRNALPSENKASQTISVPRAQTFTVESLQAIMQRIGQGGLP